MKKVFLAATKQNDGKTTVALGLILNLLERFKKIGFIKPIGQRYLEEEGAKIDEDSILVEKILETKGLRCALKDMNPIAVEKGFTEQYILKPDKAGLSSQIRQAFSRVAKDKELVVIEGTGHAAVGSVFDHSNAFVAKLLGTKAILISSGGIGRPIDEIVLNKALFEKEGTRFLGVIINKVLPDKLPKIEKLVRLGLKRKGIQVLGVIPYMPLLSYPIINHILEDKDFKLLCGKKNVHNSVKKIVVGAMQPHNALNYLVDGALLITPGDREDMILASLGSCFLASEEGPHLAGIILSGNIVPNEKIMVLLERVNIPVLLAKADTYTVASCIHDLTVKIRPDDSEKIDTLKRLIKDNVDIDKILKNL